MYVMPYTFLVVQKGIVKKTKKIAYVKVFLLKWY